MPEDANGHESLIRQQLEHPHQSIEQLLTYDDGADAEPFASTEDLDSRDGRSQLRNLRKGCALAQVEQDIELRAARPYLRQLTKMRVDLGQRDVPGSNGSNQ